MGKPGVVRASREGSRRGGGKYNKNKRRDKEREKRGEREKNKERIYREGGRALTFVCYMRECT